MPPPDPTAEALAEMMKRVAEVERHVRLLEIQLAALGEAHNMLCDVATDHYRDTSRHYLPNIDHNG